jgi:hypothetical protein
MRNFLLTGALLASAMYAANAQSHVLTLEPPRDSIDHGFTSVSSVREISDGRLLVIDSRDRTLYVANPSNASIEAVGRNGRGPLEYERPSRLVALGADSTLLLDPGNRRWLILVGARFVATLSPSDSSVERAGTAVVGADRFGHVVSTTLIDREVVEGERHRDRLAVRRVDRNTAHVDTILMIKGPESRVQTETVSGGMRVNVFQLALSVPEQAVLFPDGWLAVARQRPYRIEWRTAAGEFVAGPPLPWPDPPVRAAEIEFFRQRLERQQGRTIPAPLTGIAFVDVLSPFPTNALHALPNGMLLVARSEWSGSQGTEYDVIDRRGRNVAQVRLPTNVRVVGVGERHVFTVSVDADGIETLRRHRGWW